MNPLLNTAISASIEAGEEILKIYNTDFNVEYKKDESPLTIADMKANEIIMSYLEDTEIPVLSEEGRNIPFVERKSWEQMWIIDPLDGTKEFIKKNDEFTVNIALVRNGKPILGVVYAPVLDEIYIGEESLGAYKLKKASTIDFDIDSLLVSESKIPFAIEKSYYGIVASRSHLSLETSDYIDVLKKEHSNVKIVSKGSSLKICMVAEGSADIYPRFAPTSEWDTAAGHAVVLASGGRIVQALNLEKEVVYNKEDILNPWFIVRR
jgi:3'(2'), 5'-bisphosphate nucleotidase